jgi:hypothetical protein
LTIRTSICAAVEAVGSFVSSMAGFAGGVAPSVAESVAYSPLPTAASPTSSVLAQVFDNVGSKVQANAAIAGAAVLAVFAL